MKTLRVLVVAALAVPVLASDATAQRRGGGGAVSGGMRGAVVGGMVGGESGAQTGAKVGAVTGAARGTAQRVDNRNAMYAENQTRAEYESTAAYQSAQHSNFNQVPPEVVVTSAVAATAVPVGETVARKIDASDPAASAEGKETALPTKGKPIVWITYPADWKQKQGERFTTATSADGHAWSGISILAEVKDKQAGIERIKQQLEKSLQNVNYDDATERKGDSLVVTGTGKAKKAGIDVVFAAGVFDAGQGELVGIAFVADKDLEDQYKAAASYICQTIRTGTDLAKPK